MLNVILILDCNICGQPFERIATSSDRDPFAWKSLSMDLECAAMDCGWSFYYSAHYCGYCMPDVCFSSLLENSKPNPGWLRKQRRPARNQGSDLF